MQNYAAFKENIRTLQLSQDSPEDSEERGQQGCV